MATKLKTFDFSVPSKLTTSEKATYPWEDWLDGDIWQLTSGEDFDGHPLMMERIIRTRATGRKAKINLRHVPLDNEPWGIIVLQRNDIEGPESIKRRATSEKRAATRTANAKPKGTATATAHGKNGTNGKPVKGVSKKPARALASVS